jgi:hypothetical protein
MVTIAPILAGAVGPRHHQAMQHVQKHRAFDRKLESTPGQKLLDDRKARNFVVCGMPSALPVRSKNTEIWA